MASSLKEFSNGRGRTACTLCTRPDLAKEIVDARASVPPPSYVTVSLWLQMNGVKLSHEGVRIHLLRHTEAK
jgi:hypothetical protein